MAAIRTFYWDAKLVQPRTLLQRRKWAVGNAGDLLNPLYIERGCGLEAQNVDDGSGRRLLLVGSVAHRVLAGDLVYGVGTKGAPIPSPTEAPCTVLAARGPITTEAFRRAGHDVSGMRFEFDPGLLVPRFMSAIPDATAGDVIFVPHYRDKTIGHKLTGLRVNVVDIDLAPLDLADRIARAEFVYASSLHGLIFAHALGRPAALVRPRTQEPMIKFRDYFASIGLPWREPDDISRALKAPKPTSPVDLPASIADIRLPSRTDLVESGLLAAAPIASVTDPAAL